jgi:glycosyltransferase involved in cell wall biosynthesis
VKILHVLNELQPSGAESMLRLAAGPWHERGLQLEVLSVGTCVGPYADVLAAAGYRIHHLPLHPVRPFLEGYSRLLRAGKYDAVHVHPERANAVLATIARTVGRAGVVRTVHNVFAFDGRLRLERRLQRAALRGLGVVHVAIGESVEVSEKTHFGNRTVRVHNTFDEARFRPPTPAERRASREAFGLGSAEFAVAVVGNCSRVKNHRALIEALATAAAPPARLLHVGLEAEEDTGERALAEELDILDRTQFLGFVDDVVSVLHAADCVVMPSLYEGLSIAALETLGVGVPAVLADVPGLRDFRAHVPGIWWSAPRAPALADAIAAVADLDVVARRRRGEEAAVAVRTHFGVERHVESYVSLYRSVARRRRRPGRPTRSTPPGRLRASRDRYGSAG